MKRLTLLAACLSLAACGPPWPDGAGPAGGTAASGPRAFDIALSLSPRTAAGLSQQGEALTIAAVYVLKPADPAAGRPLSADDITPLAADSIRIPPRNGLVSVPGQALTGLLAAHGADAIHVVVTIAAGHGSGPDPLIACGMYQGPLMMARQKPVEIRCDLAR